MCYKTDFEAVLAIALEQNNVEAAKQVLLDRGLSIFKQQVWIHVVIIEGSLSCKRKKAWTLCIALLYHEMKH